MSRVVLISLLVLAGNGLLHGLWSHRWEGWRSASSQAAAARVEQIPLSVGDWEGVRVEEDLEATAGISTEFYQGVTVRYVNRNDGSTVLVFLSCGGTDDQVSHTPRVCYTVNGFECPRPDLRVSVPNGDNPAQEFWASNFTRPSEVAPVHVRVFWALSDGSGWQVPPNPRRTYRRSAIVYKCYAIRRLTTLDEPLDGDPSIGLLSTLLPSLEPVLAGQP
jgi:hypothetical protein